MLLRALILGCFFSVGVAQATFYVPQFGHGNDTQGNSFSTSITLINLSSTVINPAVVTVETFDDNGNPVNLLNKAASPFESAEAVSVLGAELEASGAAGLDSGNDDQSTLTTGWAKISTFNEVAVEVVFSISTGNGQLVTSASILPRDPTTSATIGARVNPGTVNTGVALLNPPNNGDATVTIEIFDRFGNSVGAGMVALEAGHKTARFIDEFVQGLTQFFGSVEIASDVPIVILPLRQEGVELSTQDTLPGR